MAGLDNGTCIRLEVLEELDMSTVKRTLFVKSVWEPTRLSPTSFSLAISDGHRAWTFEGSETFVKKRAEVWDKNVSWVMDKLKLLLTVVQPGIAYHLTGMLDNHRKFSFEIQDMETNLSLTANFSLVDASDPEIVTRDLLGFLLHGNEILTVDYVKKCRSFDQVLAENKALSEQNKRFAHEKKQFEQAVYKKFVAVLNSKKIKLKELKKEIEKWKIQPESKVERDDTTSSSSGEDEKEIDHQEVLRSSSNKSIRQREDGSSGSLIGASAFNDPDATQPFLDEMENKARITEFPNEDVPSNVVAALLEDTSYTALPRKRRRR
uniref:DNA repair protein XRCC4 n=1 Tax=Physcomitrium patens TaxID=3218 RepID=A0A7I4BV77_PHYPA